MVIQQPGSPQDAFWIPFAAALFTIAVIVSAVVLPELRLLHVLQALIYVAIVMLALRNSMWAIGAGLTIAFVWNRLNLFVTHDMQRELTLFWSLLQTGQMPLGPHSICPDDGVTRWDRALCSHQCLPGGTVRSKAR